MRTPPATRPGAFVFESLVPGRAWGHNRCMEFYYHGIQKDILILTVDGGIDMSTCGEFVDQVLDLIRSGSTKIIIDCEKLSYMSSYGIGVMLRLHRNARKAGGEVKLANVHTRITGVLTTMHLNKIFGIYPDVGRALLEFRAKDDGPDGAS